MPQQVGRDWQSSRLPSGDASPSSNRLHDAQLQAIVVEHEPGKIALAGSRSSVGIGPCSRPDPRRQHETLVAVPNAHGAMAKILIGGAGDLAGQLRRKPCRRAPGCGTETPSSGSSPPDAATPIANPTWRRRWQIVPRTDSWQSSPSPTSRMTGITPMKT